MSRNLAASMAVSLFLVLVAQVSLVLVGETVAAQIGLSQVGSLRRSPADLVKRYVRLDQKGARLDVMGFDVMAPYVAWKEEAIWSRVVVIQEAEVADDYRRWEIRDNLDVIIPVTFHVRGEVDLKTATFVPGERKEEVRFHVKAVGNEWRIIEPRIPPHVGMTRIVNFVREAKLEETDERQHRLLTVLEQSLREGR